MSEPELRACPAPWCFNSTPPVIVCGGSVYRVTCPRCGCSSPIRISPQHAAETWNTRRPTPDAAETLRDASDDLHQLALIRDSFAAEKGLADANKVELLRRAANAEALAQRLRTLAEGGKL